MVGITNYYVSQTVGGCESNRAPISMDIIEKPTAQIAASNTVFCEGDTIQLSYSGSGTPAMAYNWDPGTGQIIGGSGQRPLSVVYNTAGLTTVSVQVDNHGCLSEVASQAITMQPAPSLVFDVVANGCAGDTITVGLSQTSSAASSYSWTFAGGTTIFGQGAGPYGVRWDNAGLYYIAVQATLGSCTAQPFTDSISIYAKPVIQLTMLSGQNLCAYDTVRVQAVADSGSTFTWHPAQFVTEVTDSNIAHIIIPASGVVTVTAMSAYGCVNSDAIGITTHLCCELTLPDAFTPNGDGRNDVFRPITKGHQRIVAFRVVNRWGQVVFETLDEHRGWDGTMNGVPQDMDTYYYNIRYECAGGSQTFSKEGNILLVR